MTAFDKTRKKIAQKRQHNKRSMDALHVNSRDSRRLHRAQVRDEKINKIAAARRRREQPLIERVEFFQAAVKERGAEPLALDTTQHLINTFVHQHDEELAEAKKLRRPGQPGSAREDLLKLRISDLATEQEQGFLMPDLSTPENVALLVLWEGSWAYLSNLKWVRITGSGTANSASFPPT